MTSTEDLTAIFGQPAALTGRRTMHEFVHSTLRNAILDGQLTGGTRLVQSEIAATLQVSTTPVREALRDLAAEGLIRLDPHRGGVVRELDLKELEEIYRLRVVLEPEALRLAWPHLTDKLIDRVEQLHHQIQAADSAADFTHLNSEFHGAVYDLSNAPRLLGILENLTATWVMYVSASLIQDKENQVRASEGHNEILKALRTRDLDAAIASTIDHLAITKRTLETALEPS